jgi:PPP family 3-phenylpropionic acid transporter
LNPLHPGGLRALFFAYFGFIGIFSPYLSLYFAARGLSIPEIAVLMSLPQLLRIVAPPFWGWLADRTGRRVALLRVSALAALCVLALFPLASGLLGFGVLLLALFFMTAAQGPIGEAMALAAAGGDAGRYGRIRLWGSVGFILTVLGAGPVLDRWGMSALPVLMLASMGLVAAVTFALPQRVDAPPARVGASVRQRLADRALQLFLLSCFLMVFAHAALYAFYSLFLERLGYSKTAIGWLWAASVLAEILLFVLQRHLFDRFDAQRLLAFSFVVAALRFAMIGGSGGAAWILVTAQLLHAITFGLHHSASMAILQRAFEPAQQGRAQAVYVVVAYGLGGSVGGLVAGGLWERASPEGAFFGAAVASALGWAAATAGAGVARGSAAAARR